VGLPRDHSQSYHTFMYTHLFAHVDIQPQNVHILDGTAKDLEQECRKYAKAPNVIALIFTNSSQL
jgi:glucosamine-6-phosphate deaminase